MAGMSSQRTQPRKTTTEQRSSRFITLQSGRDLPSLRRGDARVGRDVPLRAVAALGHFLTELGGLISKRIHQPDQAIFRSVLPEDIDWKPFPAFPPSARLAVVVGDPAEPGPYVIRVKVPSGVKLMPHQHPEDRVYTVLSGVFYIGLGSRFDDEQLKAYPPGAVVVLPGGTPHFHWAKSGAYVTQVSGIGPLGLEYLDPIDDPRNK